MPRNIKYLWSIIVYHLCKDLDSNGFEREEREREKEREMKGGRLREKQRYTKGAGWNYAFWNDN